MTKVKEISNGSFIGGKEILSERSSLKVFNPYNGEQIGEIYCATKDDVKKAIENAQDVFVNVMKTMPGHQRADILRKTADLLELRAEEFVTQLAIEAGKPVREGRGEVRRAIQVLRFASEEAKHLTGEQIPMDSAIGGETQIGFTKRVPLGVVAAITPFNFPLNMVLHKVAPAIAAGNTIVLKPAEKTPFSAILIYKLFEEAGLPKGAFNIVMGEGAELGEDLVTHPLVKKVTFTGSNIVGWKINEMAKTKKVTLELGSNAPNIIFEDADIDATVTALVRGGFTFAGQACVSVQRVYIHREVYDELVEKLVSKVKQLKLGNPLYETTELGPMITEEASKKAESWIKEAVSQGAVVLTGGNRNGTILEPTILANVKPHMKVVCAEVFAPLLSVIPFGTEEEVIAYANDTDLGLQAGVFTNNINRALRVADALETGGVWINEVSVLRYDHMPYGGVKKSGIGKEGVKYAVEEMTDLKFIGINLLK